MMLETVHKNQKQTKSEEQILNESLERQSADEMMVESQKQPFAHGHFPRHNLNKI